MASGSFAPRRRARMDAFTDLFQSPRRQLVMIAKGNRSPAVTAACRQHRGFYLGSIGGPAAILAQSNIKKVESRLRRPRDGSDPQNRRRRFPAVHRR
jgi:fumarate hydratase class I